LKEKDKEWWQKPQGVHMEIEKNSCINNISFPLLKEKISNLKDEKTGHQRMPKVPISYNEQWGRYTITLSDMIILDNMYGINYRTQRKYLFKDVKNGSGSPWQRQLFKTAILLNPIPQLELSANLNEEDQIKFLVQDGQQRFRTFGAIINDCVRLPKSIEKCGKEYKGMGNKLFSQLTAELQAKLMTFEFELLIAFGLTKEEEEERFIIINNGTPLSNQDKRSAQVSEGASYIKSIVDGEPITHYGLLSSNFVTTSPKYTMFDITVDSKKTEYTFIGVSPFARAAEEIVAHWFNTIFHKRIQPIQQTPLNQLYAEFKKNPTELSKSLKTKFEKYLKVLNESILNYDRRNSMKGRKLLYSFFVIQKFMEKNIKIDTNTFIEDYSIAIALLKNKNKGWNPKGPVDDPSVNQEDTILFKELFRIGTSTIQIEHIISEIFETMISKMKESGRYVKQSSNRKFFTDDKLVAYSEQNGCCGYCGEPIPLEDAISDHLEPFSNGGPTELDNLVISCGECNSLKGKLPREAWMILVESGVLFKKNQKELV
jgi:hypothetical protein